MMSVAFDTLAYVKRLEQGGVPRETAVMQAEALADAIDQTLATKQDLLNMQTAVEQKVDATRTDLRREIDNVRADMKLGLSEARGEFRVEIEKAKTSMVTWLVTLTILATAAQIASRAFLH
ncbi:CCDC90 family protein [Burkholderia paludis]|uniref:hypothetical protein n=1 Tax=Burkholderia paludis TaxID=1506587 RepID=UPI00068ABA3E|nr:hypothetical protein [Burkholderia paludis]